MSQNNDIKPIAIADWPTELSHIIEDMNGRPIHVHALMAHNPLLLKAWWDFRNYSVNGGALGRRRSELVILRVGLHMKAWYEWASHVERSLACGISLEDIERVKHGGSADGWSDSEAALLKSVDALIETHSIPQDLLSALNAHFDTAQIMDIIAIHGMYVVLGCMINTWGLELDAHVAEKLPKSVTRDAFETDILKRDNGDRSGI